MSNGMMRLALLLVLASAGWAASADEIAGALPDASRVVAVGGSVTEIFYALGEQDRLVARDSTSLFPEAALALPDIGYMRQLSPESVLAVEPSAIIALEGSGPKEAVDVLKKAEVPYLTIPERFDRDGILLKIRVIGQAIGAEGEAAALADAVDKDLRAVEASAAGVTQRKRVLFILSVQDGRILASGTGTAADGIIGLAGAINAVDGFRGYKPLSPEAITVASPDFILMMMENTGAPTPPDEDLLSNPAIVSTPAAAGRHLIRMDGAYLLGFGPRTASAARELAHALYGAAD